MRAIEAGDLRSYVGPSGAQQFGRVDRKALERTGIGETTDAGVSRGQAFAAFANAVLNAVRGQPVAATGAANGARPSVESVATALRDALASDASPDAVDQWLQKIDAALGEAATALGLSSQQSARFTADFRRALADEVGSLANTAASAGASAPAASAGADSTAPVPASGAAAPATSGAPTSAIVDARYRVVQKTGIELITQEGDVVRISLRTKEGFKASAGYSPTGAYLDVSAYSKARFKVEVQGSLNADELAAIDDVLGQVDEIAADFYSGDTAAAFAAGAALEVDAEQLAGVSLRMSQSTSLRISGRAQWDNGRPVDFTSVVPAASQPVKLPPVPVADADPAPASTVVPGAETPADTPASGTPEAASDSGPVAAPATTPESTTAPPADAPTRASAMQSMTGFLAKLFDSLGTTTVAGRVEFSARAKLQLVVAAVDAAKLPGSTTEAAASKLLGDVVSATTDARAA